MHLQLSMPYIISCIDVCSTIEQEAANRSTTTGNCKMQHGIPHLQHIELFTSVNDTFANCYCMYIKTIITLHINVLYYYDATPSSKTYIFINSSIYIKSAVEEGYDIIQSSIMHHRHYEYFIFLTKSK